MTREKFAKKIHWDKVMWTAGLVNVVAMLPQLHQIVTTRNVAGLSLGMFVTYFLIQASFSLQGYFRRDKMLMVCLGLSAVVNATIISLMLYLKK